MSNETKRAAEAASGARVRPAVTVEALRKAIEARKCRSAWEKGVKAQALDFCDDLADWAAYDTNCGGKLANGVIRCENWADFREMMLNGAENWTRASEGGNGLCYDGDIAERYCTASELKRNKGGELAPNGRETWLEVQARGMKQACALLFNVWRELAEEGRDE